MKLFLSLFFLGSAHAYPLLNDLKGADRAFYLDALRTYDAQFPQEGNKARLRFRGRNYWGSKKEIETARILLEMQDPPPRAQSIPRDCQTVFCVVAHLADSQESALRAFSIAARFGVFLSFDAFFREQQKDLLWRPEYLRVLDQAMSSFRSEIFPLATLKLVYLCDDLTRFQKRAAEKPAGVATMGVENARGGFHQGAMYFMPESFQSEDAAPVTVLHEIAHHLHFSLFTPRPVFERDRLQNFFALSWSNPSAGQKTPEMEAKPSRRSEAKFVDGYASTSPYEDFAESWAYYIRNPYQLRSIAPVKFAQLESQAPRLLKKSPFFQWGDWPAWDEAALKGQTLFNAFNRWRDRVGGKTVLRKSTNPAFQWQNLLTTMTPPLEGPGNLTEFWNALTADELLIDPNVLASNEFLQNGGTSGVRHHLVLLFSKMMEGALRIFQDEVPPEAQACLSLGEPYQKHDCLRDRYLLPLWKEDGSFPSPGLNVSVAYGLADGFLDQLQL